MNLAQLAGATEYTDCISAEGYDSPNKCPGYDCNYAELNCLKLIVFTFNCV